MKPDIAKTLASPDNIIYRDQGKGYETFVKFGSGTITSGTSNATVTDSAVKAGSIILVSPTSTQSGRLYAASADIVAGTSFIVRSTSTESAGAVTFAYVISN